MSLIGKKIPEFSLPNQDGEIRSAKDYAGKRFLLFFYPKANTPGCTKEAIGFSEHLEEFKKKEVAVIGISKDPVKAQKKFAEKHGLRAELLSDENGTLSEDLGVWVEKSMYGKKYMGIARTTFLISADGLIEMIWEKVKVPGHVEAVLDAL